jgi:LysR family transcriptional regulator, hydrogen peroxide-inducible genes activator
MNLRQLQYFVAVADTRHFGRAAKRCYVSQPSLSQQVMKLERELGHPLFERLGRRIQLTEAGEALLPKARSILASFEELESDFAEELAHGGGHLSVGAIPTMAPYLLPPALQKFRKQRPDARIEIHESLTDDLIDQLIDGTVEIGVMSLPVDNALIETRHLFDEPLLACVRMGDPIAKKKSIVLEDLAGKPAIVLHSMHCLGQQVSSFCQQVRLQQNTVCYSRQLTTVQSLIGAGLGYSLLPKMCADHDSDKSRVYRAITDSEPSRPIAVAWRKGRALRPLAEEFIAAIGAAL